MERGPEYIEDSIENTRARIEDGLGDLADQMSPSRMIGSLFNSNGDSPLEMAENLVQKARENPVPALMIGAGLAGLILGGRGMSTRNGDGEVTGGPDSARRAVSGDPAERIAENAAHLRKKASDVRDNIGETASELRETAKAGIASARDAATGAIESASSYAAQANEAVARKSSELRDRTGEMVSDASLRVETSKNRMRHELRQTRVRADTAAAWVRENPIPAGLAALAVGAAAASLFSARRPARNGFDDNGQPSVSARAAAEALHREAREQEPEAPLKGSARFTDLRDAAQDGKTVKSANTRKQSSSAKTGSASKSVKSKAAKASTGSKKAVTSSKARQVSGSKDPSIK